MEQRAPRIAAFATTVAGMSFIAMLGNAFLGRYPGQDGQRVLLRPLFEGFVSGEKNDYWASTGWATQEWIWLVLSICLGLLAVWCRQDRPVPELPKQRSVAEQIADFESSATNVGTTSVASVTTNTSSIISSIVGETKSVDAAKVESATAFFPVVHWVRMRHRLFLSETPTLNQGRLNLNLNRVNLMRSSLIIVISFQKVLPTFPYLEKKIKRKFNRCLENQIQSLFQMDLLTFLCPNYLNWKSLSRSVCQRCLI